MHTRTTARDGAWQSLAWWTENLLRNSVGAADPPPPARAILPLRLTPAFRNVLNVDRRNGVPARAEPPSCAVLGCLGAKELSLSTPQAKHSHVTMGKGLEIEFTRTGIELDNLRAQTLMKCTHTHTRARARAHTHTQLQKDARKHNSECR